LSCTVSIELDGLAENEDEAASWMALYRGEAAGFQNMVTSLLELARLEFSKQPDHPDYKIRVAFEGLDEKFCKVPGGPVPDPVQPEGPVEG
jgi:hypothetical protein